MPLANDGVLVDLPEKWAHIKISGLLAVFGDA
jgi:hypothetical protein